MQDDITKVQISERYRNEELPGAELIITDEKGSELTAGFLPMHRTTWRSCPLAKYTLT